VFDKSNELEQMLFYCNRLRDEFDAVRAAAGVAAAG